MAHPRHYEAALRNIFNERPRQYSGRRRPRYRTPAELDRLAARWDWWLDLHGGDERAALGAMLTGGEAA